VVTAGARDGQLLRWRARDGRPLGVLLDAPHEPRGAGLALSGDGHAAALARADGTVELWDRTTGRLLTSFATGQGGGRGQVEWSPAGPVLATSASADLSVVLWDVSDLRHPTVRARVHAGEFPGPDVNFFSRFSPDGRTLVVGNGVLVGQGTLTFIDAADGKVLREVHLQNVADAAFTPDSETVAVSGAQAALIDVDTGETIAINATQWFSSVAFAHDGRWLVTSRFPDESLPLSLLGQAGTAAPTTAASETVVELWDATSLRPVGKPITVPAHLVCCGGPNQDGTKIVTGEFVDPATPDASTTAILWELDPQRWAELACEIAGRNLTSDEWSSYLPGHDVRTTCEQWPAGR
jgi:WD40 repeat protein